MMFSGTIQMRAIGPARRKAGTGHRGSMSGGDFVTIPGLFWRPGTKPQRANLIIYGSDFRAIESVDYASRPVITASNVFPLEPYVEVIDGEVTNVIHRFIVARGAVVTVLSYGGKLLAQHSGRDESGDGRRVDRAGQGNNSLELLVNDIGHAEDAASVPDEAPARPGRDTDHADSVAMRR